MEVAYKRNKLDADLRAKNRSDHYKLCMDENKWAMIQWDNIL